MNHPTQEEWMSYLYGEAPRAHARSLRAHLKGCTQCQEHFQAWQSAGKKLSRWSLPRELVSPEKSASPVLKWALAALLVLGLGCAMGRLSAPKVDVSALRAAIEPELKKSLLLAATQQAHETIQADWQAVLTGRTESLDTPFRRQLKTSLDQWTAKTAMTAASAAQEHVAEWVDTYQANRRADQQAVLNLLRRSEQARQVENVSLRRAVETVALVADDKFQRTESELGQLATYAQARFVSDPTYPAFDPKNHLSPKNN